MHTGIKFILVSTSISRKKMLKNVGLKFKQLKPNCNEEKYKKKLLNKKKHPKKISLELSKLKAKSLCGLQKNILFVGADSTISFSGRLVEKAKNTKEAEKKLKALSGQKHQIYSSASAYFNNKLVWYKTQKTEVKIRKLKKSEIEEYLKKSGNNILRSVGCYEIEKKGPIIIENIRGDFFNVMGFPLFPFLSFLKEFNIKKQI